jgi:hypothetical protein
MAVQPLENGEPQDDAGEDTDTDASAIAETIDSAIAETIDSATAEAIDSVTADEDDSASEETDINVSAIAEAIDSATEEAMDSLTAAANTSATTDDNTSAIEEAMDNTDGEEPDTEEEETQVQFTGRDIPPELVPQDITKEIPSIKDVMKRPLVQAVEIAPSVPPKEVIPQAEELPREMASLLAQEYDGQISMVMPEEHQVEKQITGQMNIEDVLIEWEKTKKEYEEKRKAELTRKVKDQTGAMFTDFDEKIRDGVLEQLEKEAGIQKENDSLDRLNQLKQEDGTLPEFIILEEPAEEGTEEISAEDSPAVEASPEGDIEVPAGELMAEETAEEFAAEMEEIFPKDSGGSDAGGALEDSTDHLDEQEKEIHASEAAEASQEEAEDFGEEIDTEAENREEREDVRDLTEEERALFAPFIQTKGARRRFLKALDSISLAAYTGNVIVTGEADAETVKLAKNIMKDVQDTDPNFSGVIAKVSGASLNSKSIDSTISKLNNGGLIIEKASGMNSQAVMKLLKALNQEQTGILVILEDNKKSMKRMLAAYPSLENFFNARIEIEELNNSALTAYGKQYAEVKEYAIDELGMLALQTRIEDRQTSEHIVTVSEVRELVDEAIENANRKNLTHFFELLLGKRYDGEDMIILRERDFIEK